MGNPNASVVDEIDFRLLVRGIDLDRYRDAVIESWPSNPRGFKFTFKGSGDSDLRIDLRGNRHFASGGDIDHGNERYSIREISDGEALHIIFKYDTPNDKFPRKISYAIVHIDSVGICKSKNAKGTCNWNYGKAIRHYVKDKLHL